ncbi:hypothetical protein DNU06_08355 [Putridiphycobacter roseus]|uniref:Uncharacterized protein n=1 Tax=Putridiphycobacter roseus TaxID=2219161 RepID=A0A2W1NCZ4_9FLAO|nr:hypothetical protein [Putridiphycobacter roseus]PZE17275.1 hypothetical protein DNU06_08355 [Putridiphycobacter roseus]
MKPILLFFFTVLLYTNVHSTHFSGGLISYEPTDQTNEYIFTLVNYYDCTTGDPNFLYPNSLELKLINTCDQSFINITLPVISNTEVTALCDSSLYFSNCGLGSIAGIRKAIFSVTYTLPSTCNEWKLHHTLYASYRNNPDNLNTTPYSLMTTLNNLDFPNNSSPVRNSNFPIVNLCTGQNSTLSLFVNDPDRDSLNFKLTSALDSYLGSGQYSPGYSGTNPINGISIDALTGELNFQGAFAGKYTIAIEIEEFSNNGISIGTSLLEFQIILENCSNNQPQIGNVQNFNNLGTNTTHIGNHFEACTGDQFCFDIVVNDLNTSDSIYLSSDVDSIFPGTTFSQTGFNPATASVCWNYDRDYSSAIFSISANDGACPMLPEVSRAFHIKLPHSAEILYDTLYLCDTTTAFLLSNYHSPIYWYDLNGNLLNVGTDISCNPCNTASLKFTQDTTIIGSYLTSGNCFTPDTVFIKTSFIQVDLLPDTILFCVGDTITIHSPYPQYTNVWNDNIYADSLVVDYISEGYVSLEVNFSGNCSVTDWVFANPISSSDLLIDTLIHCGANPNIAIAPNNTSWYDLGGNLLDIGMDVSCNPCGNPAFLFTNDTMVIKPINQACPEFDTLYIQPNASIDNSFSDTIFFCDEDTVQLVNPFPNYNSLWHTGSNNDTIFIHTDSTQNGFLNIYISNAICDTKKFLLFSQVTEATITPSAFGLSTGNFTNYQWIFNDTNIVSANAISHFPQFNGNYQVYVVDSIGCTDTSDIHHQHSSS